MNLEQLIERFRIDADDLTTPYLWEPEWLAMWFSEAQDEAAVRARLLLDDTTPAVTQLAVTAGVTGYILHPKVYEIVRVGFKPDGDERVCPIDLVTRERLDRDYRDWRTRPAGDLRWAMQTDTRLRLGPSPSRGGMLHIEAYRLPLKPLVNDTDKPEIHEAHHRHLVQWVLYRAFSKPDADGRDPGKAEKAYAEFERYFGPRPDADLRRSTRHDLPQVNVSYF